MSQSRMLVLTALAMIAFAGNSLLCRLALKETGIDAASFTAIRLMAGALTLWLIVRLRRDGRRPAGDWGSAWALFAYAICFSFAYIDLSTATGALLLFGAVQATMIGYGLWKGERLRPLQMIGIALALAGLAGLLLPGLSAPPLTGAVLMLGAGVAWGVYSLRGKAAGDPTCMTAGNFLRAAPLAMALGIALLPWATLYRAGTWYAMLSGALASGVGYAIWYAALRGLSAATAATVQLSVPVIAAAGGVVLLAEPMTLRLLMASVTILGGVALVIANRQSAG